MNNEINGGKKPGKMDDIEQVFQNTIESLKALHERKLELIKHCRRQENKMEAGRIINEDR